MFTINVNAGQRYGWGLDSVLIPQPVQLQRDPVSGEFLPKPRITTDVPPDPASGQIVRRDEVAGTWFTAIDPRGKIWYAIVDGAPISTDDPRWEPGSAYTDVHHDDPESVWDISTTSWIVPRSVLTKRAADAARRYRDYLWDTGFVTYPATGGHPYTYDDNLKGVISAINSTAASAIANPRSWMARDGVAVQLTHDDFMQIGIAEIQRRDAVFNRFIEISGLIASWTDQQLIDFINNSSLIW